MNKNSKMSGLLAIIGAIANVNSAYGQDANAEAEQSVHPYLGGDWISEECSPVEEGHPLTDIDGHSYRQIVRIVGGGVEDSLQFTFWYSDNSCKNLVEVHESLISCTEIARMVQEDNLLIQYTCPFDADDRYVVFMISDPSLTPERFMQLGESDELFRTETRIMGTDSDYESTLIVPNTKNPNHFTDDGTRYERITSPYSFH